MQRLNKEVGIKGSMVVGEDGLVVASELGEGLNGNVVAAMASNTISSTKKALTSLGQSKFERFVLVAAYGRMVFVDIEPVCLLVVTEKYVNIDSTHLGIMSAARQIKSICKLSL